MLVETITQLWAQEPSERPGLPMLLSMLDEVGVAAGWIREPRPTALQEGQEEREATTEYDEWATVEYDDFDKSEYGALLSSQLEQQSDETEHWQRGQQDLVRAEIRRAMEGGDAYSLHDETMGSSRWEDVQSTLLRHLQTRPTLSQLASRR